MNILFLTMNPFTGIEMHNIYSDLMKIFIENGHRPYIVTPRERKTGEKTELINFDSYSLLKVQIGNTSDVSLIEKGISTVLLSASYEKAVSKYLHNVEFGLILYSTPPITLVKPIQKLKRRYRCRTYLMLKDIFPQNAVDLGMFDEGRIIHRYFRRQEKKLYALSDRIGCMSRENVEYLLKHNPEIRRDCVEICPNGIAPHELFDRTAYKQQIRKKYGIPDGAVVFLYGGNLGKPQGVPHLVECLKDNADMPDRFFVICGSGSEYHLLEEYIRSARPSNISLIRFLPKEEYDALAAGCDVGLVFLDSRFTIPNYPSRILSYMENEMPVLVCTDGNTDVGLDAFENGYGLYCKSDDPVKFTECLNRMLTNNISAMGKKSRAFLEQHFTAEHCYRIIMREEN